MLYREKCW